MMLTGNFLKGRRGDQISEAERQALENSLSRPVDIPARARLVEAGARVHACTLLLSGMVGRYLEDADGGRQLVALHMAGEFVDLHGYPLQWLDHSVITVTQAMIATVPHDRVTALVETYPHLGRMFWFSTLLDAAMHREWTFRLGRLAAAGRVAHLFSELNFRLTKVGLSDGNRFRLALTQTDLGEACGLTNVHVSRVMAALRRRGLLTFTDGVADIPDPAALAELGAFAPDYLYFDGAARTP
jgi:CRP-like cAMP-binding protein